MTAPGAVVAWSVDPGDTLAGEDSAIRVVHAVYRDPTTGVVTVVDKTGGTRYYNRTDRVTVLHRPYRPPIHPGWRVGVFVAWARRGRARASRWRQQQHP